MIGVHQGKESKTKHKRHLLLAFSFGWYKRKYIEQDEMEPIWQILKEVVLAPFEQGDARVQDWPLMSSPLPTVGLCVLYVFLVKWIGPSLMQSRTPCNVRRLMMAYNLIMVLLSLYLFVRMGQLGWFGHYNYKCQPVDYSNSYRALEVSCVISSKDDI